MKKIILAFLFAMLTTAAFADCSHEELDAKTKVFMVKLKKLFEQAPYAFPLWRQRLQELADKEAIEGLDVNHACQQTDLFIKEIDLQLK